jgi:hypothetical protein
MILGRGVVGVADNGIVFTERPISEKRARKVALKAVGQFVDVKPVGKILAMQFVDNPIYPMGCSPDYGGDGKYETCRHCVLDGDICRIKSQVDMSDGSKANVVDSVSYKACRSWACWVFARFLNKYGWINDKCIETYDDALLDVGNVGQRPDLLLFAGSEDGSLGLFVPGISKSTLHTPPFRVKVQSTDYWVQGDKPQIVNWETTINGTGLFLVWFGNYVLPYRAFYSYPAGTQVKPGFSGSNAYLA